MIEIEKVLELAAGDYRVHLKAIAQLQVALDERNNKIEQLKTENDALKQNMLEQKGGDKK